VDVGIRFGEDALSEEFEKMMTAETAALARSKGRVCKPRS
jgi:hypothetical protein